MKLVRFQPISVRLSTTAAQPGCCYRRQDANVSPSTTFEVEYPAGVRVTRSLEAKWESEQSPTQHRPD
ncbi:hypothetical protein ABQF26_28070 [Mycolicibacterium elephantis]